MISGRLVITIQGQAASLPELPRRLAEVLAGIDLEAVKSILSMGAEPTTEHPDINFEILVD